MHVGSKLLRHLHHKQRTTHTVHFRYQSTRDWKWSQIKSAKREGVAMRERASGRAIEYKLKPAWGRAIDEEARTVHRLYIHPPARISSPPRSLLPTELIIDYPLSRTHQVPLRAGQPPWGSTTYWGVMSLPAGSRLWPPVRARVTELRSVGRPLWCASV